MAAVAGEMLEDETRCERCLRCCRTGTTFLFSHIGLCALVVGYTLVGALMFENLESFHEEESREKVVEERKRVLEDIWDFTEEPTYLVERNWSQKVYERLERFEKDIVEAVRKEGWDGSEPGLPLQWSYTGSVFFSIIVITTIGYGNIAPKTNWGKILTIVYALVGIPLLLLCLSNIGDIMAHSFKFIYWRVCCYLCVQPRKRSRQQKSRHVSRHYISTPYTSPTPTTADTVPPFFPVNGRYVPTNGVPDGLVDGRVISNKYVLQSDKDVPSLPSPTTTADWTRRDLVEASDSEDESEGTEEVAVPIWLCIAVVVSYICGGAALFMYWEEWEFLDSAYFCFVTLTTIGFGDLVPGSAVLASEAKVALGLCSLYLLLGMALLAMSFNLVQEEVTQTVKAIGKRIGIIADEDNDDEF